MSMSGDPFKNKNEISLKNIPEFDLERGVNELADMIQNKKNQLPGSIIVEIAGDQLLAKQKSEMLFGLLPYFRMTSRRDSCCL